MTFRKISVQCPRNLRYITAFSWGRIIFTHTVPKREYSSVVYRLFIGLLLASTLFACSRNNNEALYIPLSFQQLSSLSAEEFPGALKALRSVDHISSFYADDQTRAATLDFFGALTGSREISEIILAEAQNKNVTPGLAFALAHEESKYNPKAINRNKDSIDRGIFQLNSKSFPKLKTEEFYNPETNIRLGLSHLSFCLEQGKNDISALAMYNAGLTRVRKGGTPEATLGYIFRITNYRTNLEALFEAQVVAQFTSDTRLASAKIHPLKD